LQLDCPSGKKLVGLQLAQFHQPNLVEGVNQEQIYW
jgi:hypothetical protein